MRNSIERVLIDQKSIQEKVKELAAEISMGLPGQKVGNCRRSRRERWYFWATRCKEQ